MHHKRYTADRWTLGVYSPLPFDKLAESQEVALVHDGWGIHPTKSKALLEELVSKGIFPIAVDTRYGYANQSPLRAHRRGSLALRLLKQSRSTGASNPYFPEATMRGNRTNLRRPTSTLALADILGIEKFHLIGFSDGGRTVTTIAEQHPERVKSLTVVNGVGTSPIITDRRTKRSVVRSIREKRQAHRTQETVPESDRAPKSLVHRAYHIGHPRRSSRELGVIGHADGWPTKSRLAQEGVPVTVIHAKDDPVIHFDEAQEYASEHPEVKFVPVEGGHNAYYRPDVIETIADTIVQNIVQVSKEV